MPRTPLLLLAVLCCAAAAPVSSPRSYVTPNYGVRMAVPPGLYYCPLPPDWVGTDHGTTLYLPPRPRADCPADGAPVITLDYEHNVGEYDFGGPEDRPPRTDRELRRHECQGMAEGRAIRFLGRPNLLCVKRSGSTVTVLVAAVYRMERGEGDTPGHTLTLTLRTAASRLSHDLPVFRRAAAGASICGPAWAHRLPGLPRCREYPGSWW